VLVMGDSHAQQLMSPLTVLADQQGWGIVALLKGGCAIGIGAPTWSAAGPPCEEWRAAAIEYATRVQPDAVYLVVTRATPAAREVLVEGIREIADELTANGIQVIAVRDNPRFDFDMYECALEESEIAPDADAASCDVPEPGFAVGEDLDDLAAVDGVTAVDFRPWLCPDGVCRGSIGNIAVYIDDNHISDSYGRTLAPMLQEMLEVGGPLGAEAR